MTFYLILLGLYLVLYLLSLAFGAFLDALFVRFIRRQAMREAQQRRADHVPFQRWR